jgi:hypothetical protein
MARTIGEATAADTSRQPRMKPRSVELSKRLEPTVADGKPDRDPDQRSRMNARNERGGLARRPDAGNRPSDLPSDSRCSTARPEVASRIRHSAHCDGAPPPAEFARLRSSVPVGADHADWGSNAGAALGGRGTDCGRPPVAPGDPSVAMISLRRPRRAGGIGPTQEGLQATLTGQSPIVCASPRKQL